MRRTDGGIPNHMQNDITKGGISVVTMGAPTGGLQIDFNIAIANAFVPDLDDRALEIRPGFVIFKAGVKNSHGLTVQGYEFVAQEALMLPDRLEQLFRRRCAIFMEEILGRIGLKPMFIEIGGRREHLDTAFAGCGFESQVCGGQRIKA